MDYLITWAKNIVYFLILIKLISSFIPNSNMNKYIKLFSGIILIIILIKPVLALQDKEDEIIKSISSIKYDIDIRNLKSNSQTYEEINNTLAIDLYKKNIEENIISVLNGEGYFINYINIYIIDDESAENYGQIKSIDLTISKNSKDNSNLIVIDEIKTDNKEDIHEIKSSEDILIEKNIKNILFNFYNLSSDNINISISN